MATVNFVDGVTRIQAHWLNAVDELLYDTLGGATTGAQIRTAISALSNAGDVATGNYTFNGDTSITGDAHVGGDLTVDGEIHFGTLDIDAEDVSYDNAGTTVFATDVQEAITELWREKLDNHTDTFTGVLTVDGDLDVSGNISFGSMNINAEDVGFDPSTSDLVSTDVQDAIVELDSTKLKNTSDTLAGNFEVTGDTHVGGNLTFNTIDIDAIEVEYDNSASSLAATTSQAAIDELDSEKLNNTTDTLTGDFTVTGDMTVGGTLSVGEIEVPASGVTYDNTFSGLDATNVQEAIDESIEIGGVLSFNGRVGVVTPEAGDYTKAQVGLGNVDNTSDLSKPISTATQSALNDKASLAQLATKANQSDFLAATERATNNEAVAGTGTKVMTPPLTHAAFNQYGLGSPVAPSNTVNANDVGLGRWHTWSEGFTESLAVAVNLPALGGSGSAPRSWLLFCGGSSTSRMVQTATEIYGNATTRGRTFTRVKHDATWHPWVENWTSANDGPGSGLDADTLDGVQANQFLRTDVEAVKTAGHLRLNESIQLWLSNTGLLVGESGNTIFQANSGTIVFRNSTGQETLYIRQNQNIEASPGARFVGNGGGLTTPIVTIAGHRTLQASDAGAYIVSNNTGAGIITVPADVFPIGTTIMFGQFIASGSITLQAASGVTLQSPAGLSNRDVNSSFGIIQRANNIWAVVGDLA